MGRLFIDGESYDCDSIPKLTLSNIELDDCLPKFGIDLSCSCDFVGRLDPFIFMSLIYGRTVTNNWMKMHGGVMKRKRRK